MNRVAIERKVLSENDRIAERLRTALNGTDTLSLNFIGSPGAGKTALLERTLESLPRHTRVAVLTGDIQTENDANRLRRYGYPVRQITTGGACHLDARMVDAHLRDWIEDGLDLLLIENVGNLVCPTSGFILKSKSSKRRTRRAPDSTVSRRQLVKFCSGVLATLAMPERYLVQTVEAVSKARNPVLVWLQFQDCTGCSESMLRSSHPDVADIVMDLLSWEYHEVIMAGAGDYANAVLDRIVKEDKGKYLVVVEGAIPTADGGVYCAIGGHSALEAIP